MPNDNRPTIPLKITLDVPEQRKDDKEKLFATTRVFGKLMIIESANISDSFKAETLYELLDALVDSAETYQELARIERFFDSKITEFEYRGVL